MNGPGFAPLIRRWWWLLAGGALAAGLAAWLVGAHAAKVYEADAKLLVGPVGGDYQTLQAAGMIGRTYAELAVSRPVADAAARAAHLTLTPRQVENSVSSSSNDVTRIVSVRVRDPSRLAAARLANAVAAQLVQLRLRVPVERISPPASLMHDPALLRLPHAQRTTVRAAIQRAAWLSHAGDLAIIEPAISPVRPVSARTGLLIVAAAVAGALAAALCAVAIQALRGPAADHEPPEDFDVESFVNSSNGREAARELERWFEDARIQGGKP